MIRIYIAILLFIVSLYSLADEQIVLNRQANDCSLRTEIDYTWQVLTVRALHPDHKRCNIDKNDLVEIISQTLDTLKKNNNLDTIRSIFIGRLVDYPRLSEYLQKQSVNNDNWDIAGGKPRAGSINTYVGTLLLKAGVITEINTVLAPYRLKIKGVSTEKVLVTETAVPKGKRGKVPYDALVWFVLDAM